jgi:hypothetical protein
MNLPSDEPVSAADLGMVAENYATKSDRIRALARKGYARARIADALRIKYQFVRNVLTNDERLGVSLNVVQSRADGLQESTPAVFTAAAASGSFRLAVEADGLVRLPPAAISALGLKQGGMAIARLEGACLTIIGPQEGIRRAHALMRSLDIAPGRTLSDELIRERRDEAAAEDRHG